MISLPNRSTRHWVPRWLVAAGVVLLAATGSWAIASADAALLTVRPVMLPRDHGAHRGFEVEWWYTAGRLADSKGHTYFWFATVWSGAQGLVARVNVVDLGRDRVVLAREYFTSTPLAGGRARIHVGAFRLGWRRTGALGQWSLDARTPGGRLRLRLLPRRPYVLNGDHGIIQQGPGGLSAYYSEPRLAARGVLTLDGRRLTIDGQGWLDHQWGNFIGNTGSLRWDWFGCTFGDGRNLMLYQFLDRENRPSAYRAGTLVTRHNAVEHLGRFAALALHPYYRPRGALATYPLRWRLEVPSAGIDITLRSLARHQFIKNRDVPSFWEGAATITRGSPGSCIVESSRELAASP